jgi:hypothetical protein
LEQVKLPKPEEIKEEIEQEAEQEISDLRALEELEIEYNYSQQITQVVDQLINHAVHNFITKASITSSSQTPSLLDRRKFEPLTINCNLAPTFHNKTILDCHNNFFEIFSYLGMEFTLNLSATATMFNESLLKYLNIYTPILLSKLDPEELNTLHFLSKVRESNLSEEDAQLLEPLKEKYIPNRDDNIATLKSNLAKQVEYAFTYNDIIKIIKLILATRPQRQPYHEINALLPWVSKISELFGNNLTSEHKQNLKDLRFFKTPSGPANSISFNKSAMNSLLNPWPNFCGANPYMLIKYLTWTSISHMSAKKIHKWHKILQADPRKTYYLSSPTNQHELEANRLETLERIHSSEKDNYFIAFHNIFNALLFISRRQLNTSFQYSFTFLNRINYQNLLSLCWREQLPYILPLNSNSFKQKVAAIQQRWGDPSIFFNACATSSVIVILCFCEQLKTNSYSNSILVADLRTLQSEALKYLAKLPSNALKNEFLKFLAINFSSEYFSFIEKSKIQENKLAERIPQEEVQKITHSLALSFNKLHEGSEDLLGLELEGEGKEEEGEAGLDTDDQSIFRMQF